jgi:hemoglobin
MALLNLYQAVGGDETFRRLVDHFYAHVEQDPLLRPLFPADLEPGKEKQFLFLAQYFGGPDRYSQQYGHPRLRMRHFHVSIGPAESRAWLQHMLAALDEIGIPEPAYSEMRQYFERSAPFMMNQAQD